MAMLECGKDGVDGSRASVSMVVAVVTTLAIVVVCGGGGGGGSGGGGDGGTDAVACKFIT